MALKDRGLIKFPALVVGETGISVEREAGVYTFALDLLPFGTSPTLPDVTLARVLVIIDNGDGTSSYTLMTLAALSAALGSKTQIITDNTVTVVAADTALVIVNKTVGSATALTLPDSDSKIGRVKVVDFKGDSDTNPITISPTGTDKFNGNQSTWTLNAPGASVVFDPIASLGYAV